MKNFRIYPKTSSPCNCMNIRRASRAVTQFYDDLLAPSGLSITQMGILLTVSSLGSPSMSELASEFRIDRTTLNRNLKPLADAGFIVLKRGSDARRREAAITPQGKQSLGKAQTLWCEAQQAMADYLGENDLNNLKATLAKLEDMVP